MENSIEAILFYKNQPTSLKSLAKILDKSESEVREGLENLKKSLENRGLTLVENEGEYSLATSNQNSELINKIAKEEISGDIGKAGLETLSIILYKGSASRRDIDYIRGVNSTFILRSLLVRGLVEKTENEKDGRAFLYKPTLELLAFLGVESLSLLPEFSRVKAEIEKIESSKENQDAN